MTNDRPGVFFTARVTWRENSNEKKVGGRSERRQRAKAGRERERQEALQEQFGQKSGARERKAEVSLQERGQQGEEVREAEKTRAGTDWERKLESGRG